MSGNAKQRVTLSNLNEPQQMRELNRQLTWIWDQLLGGLSLKSLNAGTQKVIDSKAESSEVNELGEVVSKHSTAIEQTAEKIELKADKTTVDALGNAVSEHSTKIAQTAEKIESKADKSVVDALTGTVTEQGTQITQTAEKVESKAEKTVVDALGNTVSEHSAQISQTPEQIRMAVQSVQTGGRNLLRGTKPMDFSFFSFDASGAAAMGTYETHEGGLHVINSQSNLRVWLGGKLKVSAGQSLTVSFKYKMLNGMSPVQIQANWYRSADDTAPGYADSDPDYEPDETHFPQTMTMVDGGWGWVQAAFTVPDGCTLAAFAFRSGRDFELYDCEYLVREFKIELGTKATDWSPAPEDTDAAIAKVSAELTVQAGAINANATKIETVNQSAANAQNTANAAQTAAGNAQNSANAAQSTADAAQQTADANAANLNEVATRVTTAETSISALDGQVKTKVSQTEFNALGGRVSGAESAITLQADQIASKVEKTEFDALGNTVSQMGTEIRQNEEEILLLAGRTVGGTNLVRFGTIGFAAVMDGSVYTDYGMWADVDETWYYRSRKMIALKPFSGEYTMVQFSGVPLKKDTEYTLSFNLWHGSGGSGITMTPNLWNEGRGVDWGFMGTIDVNANVPTRYEHTFVCTATDTYYLRFISFNGNDAAIYLSDVKLEEGNTATAWSAHPEEFRVGTSVEITKERFKVVSPETLIAIPSADGETMVAQFDENGATMDRITANNVAYRYEGPAAVYVNPAATGDQIAAGNYFRSLSDVFSKLNGRFLDMAELTVYMQGNDYGVLELARVTGGAVTIHGNGAALTGGLGIVDCGSRVYVRNLNIVSGGSTPAAWVYGKGAWVQWYGCTFNGAGAQHGLYFSEGGAGMVWECGLYNAPALLYAGPVCDVTAVNLRGGECTDFLSTNGCTMKLGGTRPDGAWTQGVVSLLAPADPLALTVDYGTAQPSVPVIQTAEYDFLYSDSYAGGWSAFADEDVRQGYNGQRIYGVIWFDAAAVRSALAGKTINQASLRLYMHKGVGRGVGVSVQLYGTNMEYGGRSGAPELTASYGTIGTAEPGAVNEITVPAQVIADIVGGTVQALVLLSDDAERYKDRDYSRNYARFDGSTSGDGSTKPRLTVVYQ